MKILIINGPNLNLLGRREPSVYGDESFDSYFKTLENKYPDVLLEYFQSNCEGEIITRRSVFHTTPSIYLLSAIMICYFRTYSKIQPRHSVFPALTLFR